MIFFKKKNPFSNDIEPLVNQTIGGQSVMFRLCKEILLLPEEEIRKIEITYFCLTVLCSCYIDSPRIAFFTDKGTPLDEKTSRDSAADVVDNVAIKVLKKSIPSCGETISFKESVVEYKKKYKDYFPYLSILKEHPAGVFQGDRIERFNKQISSAEKEETQFNLTELLLVFFQSVSVKKKSIPPMTFIGSSIMLFRDFYIDNVVFINQKLVEQKLKTTLGYSLD